MQQQLIPEWESIDAVILAWPHQNTDWAPWLSSARDTYINLLTRINEAGAGVILLAAQEDIDALKSALPSTANVLIMAAQYNDTWVRDYAFLTCRRNNDGLTSHIPVEFTFNGWGNKFNAAKDNEVNRKYLFSLCQFPPEQCDIVAEGGALEIDASGHLLSTSMCLFNPERNGKLSAQEYRQYFTDYIGASKITLFEYGHLEGDDTDGHIDTLVRFTPTKGLVIQAADNRKDDSHFASLNALCEECSEQLPDHQQYRLPLPAIFTAEGDRLPASYANFLICNDSILLPVYGQPEDSDAIEIMQQAYPQHKIVAVNCAVLVKQYGSLHCITMQVPQNTLRPEVVAQLNKGVSVYAPE